MWEPFARRGEALEDDGDHADAELFRREALARCIAQMGRHHRDTTACLAALGHNLTAQGRLGEAEAWFREAVAIEGNRWSFLRDLAVNLSSQERHAEAEEFYRRSLAESLAAFRGKPDVSMLSEYRMLADNLEVQRRWAEAEPLRRAELEIYWDDCSGGADLPVAWGFDRLAANVTAQGRHDDAELMLRGAFYIYLDAYLQELEGPRQHASAQEPDAAIQALKRETVARSDRLARNLEAQGRHAEARDIRHRAPALGAAWRWEDAYPLYREALDRAIALYGEVPRIQTVRSFEQLARSLEAKQRFADAETMRRQVLAFHQSDSYPDDEAIARSRTNLADTLRSHAAHLERQGDLDGAQRLLSERLDISEWHRSVGCPGDGALARVLEAQGFHVQAEAIRRWWLRFEQEAITSQCDPYLTDFYRALADNLLAQARFAEAESTYRSAIACELAFDDLQGGIGPELAELMNSLAAVLDLLGRGEEADDCRRRAGGSPPMPGTDSGT